MSSKGSKILISLLAIAALVVMAVIGCQPEIKVETMGVTNLDSLHLGDVAATETPILMVDGESGNAGNLAEMRVAATPVWYVNASGVAAQTGVLLGPNGSASAPAFSFSSDTDSGMYRVGANNVGMAVSATLISDWSTSNLDMNNLPIVNVGASGTDFGTDGSLTTAVTVTITSGGLTVTAGGARVGGNASVTGAADAEQLVVTGYTTQTNSVFVVEDSSNADIFEVTTSQANLNNNPLVNVGASGTDFGTDGSLTTAQTVTISAGNVVAPAGAAGSPGYTFASDTDCGLYRVGANNIGMAVTSTLISDWSASGMDMNNLPVLNVGAAGTDFGSDGSLTTALTITITSGGLTVTAGGATVGGNASITGAADAEQLVVTGYTTQTNSVFVVEDSSNADIFEVTTSQANLNNNPLVNVGASGTDFGTDGSLTTAQTITVTTGGLVVSAGGATITAGGLTISDGDAVVADDLRITAQTALTVTDATGFTPTGTYQGLQVSAASSEVTPTINMGTAGDLLVLINTTTPTISIADSGTTMLSAEWEAGQYDTLTLLCDGTNWLELSRSNN